MKNLVYYIASVVIVYVTAIDGDSLILQGKEMRLQGIDAPEYNQICFDKDNKEYSCGKKAYQHLKRLLNDKTECQIITKDKYKRYVAICGDINRNMVASGWAVAYSRYSQEYIEDEKDAKKNKRGIWQGKFMKPELHRALEKASIKKNIH